MVGFTRIEVQILVMFFAHVSPATSLRLPDASKANYATMVSSKTKFPYEATSIFISVSLRSYIGWKPHQHSILRLQVQPATCPIMPRNVPRKDRRHHKSKDSATQPLPRWNHNHSRRQQKWWTADDDESLPRLGQYVVSNPVANAVSQTQTGGLTHTFPSYQRDHKLACGGPGSYHQKNKRARLFQQSPRVVMLSSSEIKEYLLQAVEEGKRMVDEWINSEFEKASAPDRDVVIWDACAMDWQPEKTIVIPQTVTIRYPWDAEEDTGKGRSRRKRSGRDGIMEETL